MNISLIKDINNHKIIIFFQAVRLYFLRLTTNLIAKFIYMIFELYY